MVERTLAEVQVELETRNRDGLLELSKHSLLIGTIQPLDPATNSYRMIGGMLVEKTVAEMLVEKTLAEETRNMDELQELNEHLLVIGVIQLLDPTRKSYI